MDFTNINDPAAVKSLLEQLRASQAWQNTVNAQTHASPAHDPAAEHTLTRDEASAPATTIAPGSSVAALLAQLQANSEGSSSTAAPYATSLFPTPDIPEHTTQHHPHFSAESTSVPSFSSATPSSHRQDLRHVSFQQALPHLARLSEDPEFVSAISKMKKEQADLETRMYEERNAILAAQQEKVRVAKIRAQMTGGSGFTQFEADSMSDAFRKELLKFDAERVLPAWDGLLAKQQASLEALGVPGMFQSMSKVDRERQQRVVQVLAGVDTD